MPRFKCEVRYEVPKYFSFLVEAKSEEEASKIAAAALAAGAFMGVDFETAEESATPEEISSVELADDGDDFTGWEIIKDGKLVAVDG